MRYPQQKMAFPKLPSGDQRLVQIQDSALADASRRSGRHLVCKPGCTQCCHGVFAMHQLDALRLQTGWLQLAGQNPEQARRIQERARQFIAEYGAEFPGDPETGILGITETEQERFEEYANDAPCPVLNPETGLCDLYAFRPMTCRIFGPPVRSEQDGGLGICELCFQEASPEEIASCEMAVDPEGLEDGLIAEAEQQTGKTGTTIIAFCLASLNGDAE
jgi:Fe-S-cluster containining protein